MPHANQAIGPYTLVRLLGTGGFGEVWLATKEGRQYAVKLPRSGQVEWQAVTQEIGLWVICGQHPNVLPFVDAKVFNGQIAIVSEYAPDGSLADLLQQKGALPAQQALELTLGILDGLAHLHANGIIHRDLKPANVLLHGATPRLADFGISRIMTVSDDTVNMAGTLSYMAPESFQYIRNVQTDIWAVGVIFYKLLEGQLPFRQRTQDDLIKAIKLYPPGTMSGTILPALQQIVLKALAKNPSERYPSAAEMRQALATFAAPVFSPGPNTVEIENATLPLAAFAAPVLLPDTTLDVPRLIPYRKGDKWGFCDAQKNIQIPPKYDWAWLFHEGLAQVQVWGLKWVEYGYIDCTGREVIPLIYDDARCFSEGLAQVRLDGRWGQIDRTGREVIPFKYASMSGFSDGLASVSLGLGYDKCGYIDRTGREVIPLMYDGTRPFSEGLAEVGLNDKCGWTDRTGREVIPLMYDGTSLFSEGLAGVKLNGKWGYIDRTGREVIPLMYDWIQSFSDGLAGVGLNDKCGWVDRTGREVIPLIYDGCDLFGGSFSDGLALVRLKDKCGYIDCAGREAIPLKYDDASCFREGLAFVKLNGKWGYIDRTGREVIPLKYDEAHCFSEGLAFVKLNGKYGYIDRTGREVTPLKYDDASCFREGLAFVKLNGKYGYIDRTGREVIPLKYGCWMWINFFSDGLALMELNGKSGYIGRDGTEYWED